MNIFRIFLAFSWVLIIGITIYAISKLGFNWPSVYFGDLITHAWRSQFNTDFLIHLILLCSWIVWREDSKLNGAIYGFLSIFMGGMFGFAYLFYATFKAEGNIKALLLGAHYSEK